MGSRDPLLHMDPLIGGGRARRGGGEGTPKRCTYRFTTPNGFMCSYNYMPFLYDAFGNHAVSFLPRKLN